jgi:hypothetical protein
MLYKYIRKVELPIILRHCWWSSSVLLGEFWNSVIIRISIVSFQILYSTLSLVLDNTFLGYFPCSWKHVLKLDLLKNKYECILYTFSVFINFSFVRNGLDNKKGVWTAYEETFSGYAVVFPLLYTSFACLVFAPKYLRSETFAVY